MKIRDVFTIWGWYNTIDWVAYTEMCFSQVWGLDVRSRCQDGEVLVEALFLIHRKLSFHGVLTWQRERASSPPLLVRTLIPWWGLYLYGLITFQRSHLQLPSHWSFDI